MKTITVDVKSKGNVLGTLSIPQFDKIEEAIEKLGREKVLDLINRMYKTDLMNADRRDKTTTSNPMAELIRQLKSNPSVLAKIQQMLADKKPDQETPPAAPAVPAAKK